MIQPAYIIEICSLISGATPYELMLRTKEREIVYKRFLCIYILKRYGHVENIRIAELFGFVESGIRSALLSVFTIRGKFAKDRSEQQLCDWIDQVEMCFK